MGLNRGVIARAGKTLRVSEGRLRACTTQKRLFHLRSSSLRLSYAANTDVFKILGVSVLRDNCTRALKSKLRAACSSNSSMTRSMERMRWKMGAKGRLKMSFGRRKKCRWRDLTHGYRRSRPFSICTSNCNLDFPLDRNCDTLQGAAAAPAASGLTDALTGARAHAAFGQTRESAVRTGVIWLECAACADARLSDGGRTRNMPVEKRNLIKCALGG
jgi:hypothetical protein